MVKKFFGIIFLAALTALSLSVQAQTYPTKLLGYEQQIDDIISGMTLEENLLDTLTRLLTLDVLMLVPPTFSMLV